MYGEGQLCKVVYENKVINWRTIASTIKALVNKKGAEPKIVTKVLF